MEKHIFSDPDAAVIYQGLMLIVSAIEDLKQIVLMDRDEDTDADDA
jgi:hypothetical protein